VLIVSLQRGLRVQVPTRDSVLRAGDRLAVAMAPEAAHYLPTLREGLEARRATMG
jgi:Trk K+ transport system NAD-binding subunit